MGRDDVRFAAAARDDGIRKISRYTWRAGAVGIACSALIAAAFGHHGGTRQPSTGTSPARAEARTRSWCRRSPRLPRPARAR